jgi:hypothetical protein
MKKINLLLIAALALSIFSFISCKEEEPAPIENPPTTTGTLPSELRFNGGDYEGLVVKFAYDNNNRMTKDQFIYSGHVEYTRNYVYDESGKLVKITFTDDDNNECGTTYYTYSGNNITCSNSTEIYEFENDRLVKIYHYHGSDITFSYDLKGNITKINDGWWAISYGDKNGVFSKINTPKWVMWDYMDGFEFQIVNNPVKYTYNGGSASIEYEYLSFNNSDYPTKIKIGGGIICEIKYIEAK